MVSCFLVPFAFLLFSVAKLVGNWNLVSAVVAYDYNTGVLLLKIYGAFHLAIIPAMILF